MAIAFTSSIRIRATLIPSTHQNQVGSRFVGLKAVSFTPQRRAFPSLQSTSTSSSGSRVFWVTKPDKVKKVCEVVKKQLALTDDASLTPESNFSEMGADSLDTGEGGSENITTVQAAANMIEKYLEKVKVV